MVRLAVIGFGGRISGMVAGMRNADPEVELVAVADPDAEGVRTRLKGEWQPKWADVKIYPDADQLLENAEKYDGLLIGTRCHMHTPMAVKVASLGLPLFLEKPVAIDEQQLGELARAYQDKLDKVVVSFPLRVTPLFLAALEIVRSGRLGTINQVQAFNNVPYGGVYFGEWYRNYDQVGGLWLQKATHDFDYITRMVGQRPTTVAATTTRKIYVGDMPHDLRCSKCDKTETCPESPKALQHRGDGGGMGMQDHWCSFSKDLKNEDAGSALIQYADGTHTAYSQNFVTRRAGGARGALITGYKGSLEFDWFTNQIKVIDHHGDTRVDNVEVKAGSGHGGGDAVLCQMYVDLIRQQAVPQSTLRDGLLSAAMCLAARRSSQTNTFQAIPAVEDLAK